MEVQSLAWLAVRITIDRVLFDLDGVLVDSRAVVERHWRAFACKYGLDSAEVLSSIHGRRTADNIAVFAPHLDAAAATREFEQLETEDVAGVHALPGAANLVNGLPAGTWAVVTSGSLAVASARIEAAGLPVPEVLITADDIDRGKPEPDGYVAATERLSAPPERCLVVEDTPPGLAAGRAAGARTLGLLTTHELTELDATVLAADLSACFLCQTAHRGPVTLDIDAVPTPSPGWGDTTTAD
jgi:sugar-phosphatase